MPTFNVRVDLALKRPPRHEISVWVIIDAPNEATAWQDACEIAESMPARNGMVKGEYPKQTFTAHIPAMIVGTQIEYQFD